MLRCFPLTVPCFALLVALFVWPAPAGAQTPPDDHGDTLADATFIAVPSTTAGKLEDGGDNDYFRLVVDQSTILAVETTGSTDTFGTLFDGSGALLEEDDDGGTGVNFKIVRRVGAGTYYVNVNPYSSTTTGTYELRVSTSSSAVTSIYFPIEPEDGDTYTLGETIVVQVEVIDIESFLSDFNLSSGRLTVAIGEKTRPFVWGRWDEGGIFFYYAVQAADLDGDGISIPANALTLRARSSDAPDLSHAAVGADPDQKVDGTIVVPPKIRSFSFAPPRQADPETFYVYGDTYELGEPILVSVAFDKAVRVTGRPELEIVIGGRSRRASYVPGGVSPFVDFAYTVEAGDSGTVTIPEADSLTLNGGTIRMRGSAATAADLTHDAFTRQFEQYRADGTVVRAPTMIRGRFSTSFPVNWPVFGRGETITVAVPLDRQVEVSGEPQVALRLGTTTRYASFRELHVQGRQVHLWFDYVVQAEDMAADGIVIPEDPLDLNGGSITLKGDSSIAADLTNHFPDDFAYLQVDGSTSGFLVVAGVSLSREPATGSSYSLGEPIMTQACFSGVVQWSGRPEMVIQVGARTRQASLVGKAGVYADVLFDCLRYQYVVQAEDLENEGISIPANSLTGGSISLAGDSSVVAHSTTREVLPDPRLDRRVDGSIAVAPRVTNVSFVGSPRGGDTYGPGETIQARVAFDKALAVSGEPRLLLTVGGRTREAAYKRQEPGRAFGWIDDFTAAVFEYVVQPGDMDTDGISIAANALELNGGSLTLEGSPGTAADLSHSAVNPDETRLVDTPDTEPVFSTAIAGQVWVVNAAVSLELPEAEGDGMLTYSLLPEVPAGLAFDAETRLLSGMPLAAADLMAFEYTATDGDLEDPESATLRFSVTVIAEPTMEVGGESAGDDAVEVTWRGRWTDAGRGRLAIEARSPTMDWTVVGTVDPSSGEFRVLGLEPDTPYTFRLRFESSYGVAARTASAQTAAEYSEEFSVTTGSYTGPCRSGGKYLCLRDGRFELRADWSNPDRAGDFGGGTAVPVDISDESGLFWFFSPANIELVTKVLDGSRLNGHYWMFFGALSDVEYWLTLRDTAAGGSQRTYHNPPKEICGQSDTRAFPGDLAALLGMSSAAEGSSGVGDLEPVSLSAVPLDVTNVAESEESAGQCSATGSRLCLLEDRFAVEVKFIDPNISDPEVDPEGTATVASSLGTANTGFFWFFNQENIELAVKVLDGRGINGKFWLLYGALSDVEYEITVTDTVMDEVKIYRNEAGSICGEVDTGAF